MNIILFTVYRFYPPNRKSYCSFNDSRLSLPSQFTPVLTLPPVNVKSGVISQKCFSSAEIPGTALLQFYQLPIVKGNSGAEAKILNTIAGGLERQFEKHGHGGRVEALDAEELNTEQDKATLLHLRDLFVRAKTHADAVQRGEEAPNKVLGRTLLKDLKSIEAQTAGVAAGGVKDAVMVRYLSQLCKTQIMMAEELNKKLKGQDEE